jgi:PKD repeat protein
VVRNRASGVAALLVVLVIVASVRAQPASGSDTFEIENLAVSAQSPVSLEDGALAFLRSESDEGFDLNGDLDTADQVLQVRSAEAAVINVGLAGISAPLPLAGGGLVFLVSESSQGQTDMNGNGTTLDVIPHVWTPDGMVSSLGLAGTGPVPLAGGGFAFVVNELTEGVDLNNDNDTSDLVHHVWHPDGSVTNVQLAARFDSTQVALPQGGFGFTVPENQQGQDLNADGDLFDLVMHVWRDDGFVNSQFATTLTVPLTTLSGGGFAFVVPEASQNNDDMNGNGKRTDFVVHLWHPDGTITFVEHSVLAAGGLTAMSDGGLAFSALEVADGIDLNGDGDVFDSVVQLWQPNGAISNLAKAGVPISPVGNGGLAFLVVERAQQEDLNEDTDLDDYVIHIRTTDGSIDNLGSAVSFPVDVLALTDGGLAYGALESQQGRDLNGDTDTFDQVLHIWRPGELAKNVGLAITSAGGGAALADGEYAFLADEAAHSDDLNGDGDEGDTVLQVSATDGTTQSLELAVLSSLSGPVALVDSRIAFSVSESGQLRDLNGDDDLMDRVLHVAKRRSNSPPVADAGGPYTGLEGSQVSFDALTSSDPDADELTYDWDYGDGHAAADAGPAPSHAYTDDGSYNVCVTVFDGTEDDQDCTTAHISNVAPTVGLISVPQDLVEVGTFASTSANFTDPGTLDTHTASWDWGDGSTTAGVVIETDGDGTVSGGHVYTDAGVYTVALTVADKDGGSDSEIYEFVVVYDPEGGFVTGGGTIDSPEGAYTADPLLTGKATFGFVSKYKKGATTPTGNTEFQFRAADFNFHSSSYEWLVVTGTDYAMFKGSGKIDGDGDYLFRIWAGDADPDAFRIKIWTEDEAGAENVVYDNGSDQGLAGGNIVIHTK